MIVLEKLQSYPVHSFTQLTALSNMGQLCSVVNQIEKNFAPRLHPLQEGWEKMNYLQYFVINLKGLVISGW